VGYNVAKALTTLGDTVRFASMVGKDMGGTVTRAQLQRDGIPQTYVIEELEQTPRSVILYEPGGKRMINVDLKDVQERAYPPVLFENAAHGVDLAVLCNINFSRPFLDHVKAQGVPVATDVHAISDLHSAYDGAFMAAADIVFMSDEHLPTDPETWTRQVWDVYAPAVTVVGMGGRGALLGVRDAHQITLIPAVQTRPIVNTIGAGDALFSAFVHAYARTRDPVLALRQAVVFASWKIGVAGAADGFLDVAALAALCADVYGVA
ncbi:MAG: carbohydrate kinase family protein, partial [Anaerolineae bacterium]|nr:carbohydrate kinase family protein [Anaerolineae bacterium]